MQMNNLTQRCWSTVSLMGIVLVGWLVTGCVPLEPVAQNVSSVAEPTFSVSAEAPNEAIVLQEAGQVIIDVTSPKGMGRVQIQLPPPPRDQELRIRFHLKGLERLLITTESVTVMASASTLVPDSDSEPFMVIQEMVNSDSTNQGSNPLTESDPFWLTIEPQSEDAIDVIIPIDLLNEAGEQVTIEWLDFYR